MFKKISKVLVLTLILSLVTSQTAYAKLTYSNKMFDGKTYYHDYYLYVNSKEIKSPSMINKDYTNYIPLKAVVEAMGDKCTISGKTATVTQKNKNKLIFTANNSKYKINGKTAQFANQSADLVNYTNYYPIIKNNVFYIPYGNLTKLFGYDIHESYTQGKPTSKSLTDTTKYYIGKAPSYYYKKSEFPYIYQYEIDAKPNNPGDKLKILPKENFTAFNKTSTTKDPVKDLLHFSDTMPDFVVDVPSKFPGYNTDTSDAVKKKYIDALRNGTYQPDHTDFGYDAIGFY
ncbi:MAG TPA: stalk domain-containing protein, partial [Mobilitalea sp.]|nr:stalk domain-containing protein [Mobilitalea sp.]